MRFCLALALVFSSLISTAQSTGAAKTSPKPNKSVEELKAERAKAVHENELIIGIQQATSAKEWQKAEELSKELVAMEPNRWQFHQTLANALLNQGKYEEAISMYEKGLALASKEPEPQNDPAKAKDRNRAMSQMLVSEGNAYLKLRKNDEAARAYSKAASIDPNPATAYFNLCATMYNAGNVEGALPACDKAIAADPTKADAYFIKGSLLIADSKVSKDGRLQAPAGTQEALEKYLELAPNGPHVSDVKQMLDAIGAKITTTYKPK